MAVGTYQGVAGLAPRLFTLEEETGSHHGHGHVHRTRMLICMHNWGSSLHLPPHRRSSSIHRHRRVRPHALEEHEELVARHRSALGRVADATYMSDADTALLLFLTLFFSSPPGAVPTAPSAAVVRGTWVSCAWAEVYFLFGAREA